MMKQSIVKLIATGSIASLLMFNSTAFADHGKRADSRHSNVDYGRVIDVYPVYKRVAHQRPVKECRVRPGHRPHQHNSHGHYRNDKHLRPEALVGGVVGGVIGNHIGKKIKHATGDRHATFGGTIAGAIIGSVIADNAHRPHSGHQNHHRPAKHCTTVYETYYQREVDFYKVTYMWRGHQYRTRTEHHPGHRIPLQVSVQPYNNHNRPYRETNYGSHNGHNHRVKKQKRYKKRVIRDR